MGNMLELGKKYEDYIVDLRREFHRFPELSLEEVETTKRIVRELTAMGLDVETFEDMPGCVGTLRGGKPGKTVLIRSDIDGLPVPEKTGLPFTSENQGRSHACGHDAHIAMTLGAAKILCEKKDELPGNVKFYFQTAEELACGCRMGIEHGVAKDVDASIGGHVWGWFHAPKINLEAGPRMASCDNFTLTVRGKAANGLTPQNGKDAIVAAAAVIMNAQQIVSRWNDPQNALVVTIGTFDGGESPDTVADEVKMVGTVRTYSREVRAEVEGKLRQIAEDTAKTYGCTAELEYNYLCGPIINDNEELLALARNSGAKLFGEDVFVEMEKVTGSEDFSYLMEAVPSLYCYLGGWSDDVPGSDKPNHHECYTVDENILHRGAAFYAQFAEDFLNSNFKK